MADRAKIESAITKLRPGLASDGFDLRLGDVKGSESVEVVLEAKPDACYDCLVPEELLVQMLDTAIHNEDPQAGSVALKKVGFED